MSLHLSNILFVPGIKRNLISISALEDKGYQITFSEGKVLAWPTKFGIKSVRAIGNRYDSLYKLLANPIRALIHEAPESSELWHRRLGHLHYQALPSLERMVKETGIKREFCVPYNPQQNGVAERKNRTIVEAAKAMIHDQDLQIFLWAETSKTTVYI
ncbi:uncharacterized protein LOC131857063 [Cryptomeria japonica]|uniref:uncharacterized protein LOC131857063 n=1 Tax=Cryptomeria japonica TaxID=3369 RepID=UPI0027DA6CD2|nr:uncharacterized protein LOC131857063 [Cryptomeria japonica]